MEIKVFRRDWSEKLKKDDMSKELEALRQLHMAGAYVSESLRNKITPSKATELKNVLYHAIKRNEPMKVEIKTYTNGFFKRRACSVCDTTIQKEFAYCPYCGQKLDWSDEKMLKEKLERHIKMLIDAFNHNLDNSNEYSSAYNNFLRTEIEMLEKILDEIK